jgi:hypothetical protein
VSSFVQLGQLEGLSAEERESWKMVWLRLEALDNLILGVQDSRQQTPRREPTFSTGGTRK